MSRIELIRGARGCKALPAMMLALFLVGCFHGPTVYKPREQVTLDRRGVGDPAGFELKLVATGFSAPVAMAFDADGTQFVAEAGLEGDEPRIYAIKPDST